MPRRITLNEILDWETNYRVQFVNSLGGFKSLNLIGTQNDSGQMNLSIFNSIVHIGSSPPLFAFVCRPANRERHTMENILDTGYYTMNHVQESFLQKAHQSSAKFAREDSEFEQCGLTSELLDDFPAPFVKESAVQFGLSFQEDHALMNKTTLIIGRVECVYIDESILAKDGYLNLEQAGSLAGAGCDAYYATELKERMAYARPEEEPKKLTES